MNREERKSLVRELRKWFLAAGDALDQIDADERLMCNTLEWLLIGVTYIDDGHPALRQIVRAMDGLRARLGEEGGT